MAEISQDLINEINALSKKSKTVGLSEEEKQRQQVLRAEYIKAFRSGFKQHLENIKVVDEKGNDVTPIKLKKTKKHH